jgi:hypothetical protein
MRPQIAGYETVTEQDLLEHMTRTGSTITIAEARANLEEIMDTFKYFLEQGYGITTDFLIINPVMSGIFHDKDDRFDPARHKMMFKVRLGRRFAGVSNAIKVEKIDPPAHAPLPLMLEDVTSTTVNGQLTPGGTAILSGKRLRFRQDDPQQGIFLIASGGDKLRIERIFSHSHARAVFMLPASLPVDEYTLEVHTILPRGKDVRKGILPEKLIVE